MPRGQSHRQRTRTQATDDAAAERRAARQEAQRAARQEQNNRAQNVAALTGANNVPAQSRQSTAYMTGANNAANVNQAAYAYAPPQSFGDILKGIFAPKDQSGGTWQGNKLYIDAVSKAFGTSPYTPYSSPDSQRRQAIEDFISPGYQVPDVSKTVIERYRDWLNSAANSAAGYTTPYFPSPDFYSPDNTPTSSGGGGGWYGGGGGGWGGYGSYGGGSSSNSDWLRGLLTRWNI